MSHPRPIPPVTQVNYRQFFGPEDDNKSCAVWLGAWFWFFWCVRSLSLSRQATTSITPDKNRGPVRANMHPLSDYYIQTLAYLGVKLQVFSTFSHPQCSLPPNLIPWLVPWANLTLIILFSEILKFSKIISSKSKKYCEK